MKKPSTFTGIFMIIDTGFFNIQVLQRALRMFEIELVPFGSQEPIAQQARTRPDIIQAYICNFGLHWFTIRRFARQYFNLNSMYYVPEFVPVQILSEYLNLIKENGYSVFIVHGTLPACLADQQLSINPITRHEYNELIKDMPKLIMDGEVIGGPNDLSKNGNLVVQLSPDLYKEFQKNPDDPKIRQMILEKLPKGVLLEDDPEHATCTNPHHHHHQHQQRPKKILIARMPERRTDKQSMGVYNCPDCHQQHPVVSEHFEEQLFDDTSMDNPNEPQHRSQMITRRVTQMIMSEPNFDDSNASSVQQRIVTTSTVVVMSQRRNNTFIDDVNIPKMTSPSLKMKNEEDFILQHVMAQELLGDSGMNDDISIPPLLDDQAEQVYQRMLDKVIANSLQDSDSQTKRIEQFPESIPIKTTNSEPVTIKMPSSLSSPPPPSTTTTTNAHSPPSTNIHSSSPTNTYSPSPNASLSAPPNTPLSPPTNALLSPPTNTSLAPPTNTSLPPPTTTTTNSSPPLITVDLPQPTTTNSTPSSPLMTVDSPPPTLRHSDFVESPTVEGKLFKT
jgi:hypothetical protein